MKIVLSDAKTLMIVFFSHTTDEKLLTNFGMNWNEEKTQHVKINVDPKLILFGGVFFSNVRMEKK